MRLGHVQGADAIPLASMGLEVGLSRTLALLLRQAQRCFWSKMRWEYRSGSTSRDLHGKKIVRSASLIPNLFFFLLIGRTLSPTLLRAAFRLARHPRLPFSQAVFQ